VRKSSLPNFRGCRALVLHRSDGNSETLLRQLESLGLTARRTWPADDVSAEGVDVAFFDADLGYDGLFAWPASRAPIPLIAVMGSEAPGRIEWTLAQGPSAYLIKPIGSTGVFSALAIAFRTFETQQRLHGTLADLTRRVEARPVLFKAILVVMESFGVGDAEAYQMLRTNSMKHRVSIEELSSLIVGTPDSVRDLMGNANRRFLRQATPG
jgi:AmiR/NasT family two-component response regulator